MAWSSASASCASAPPLRRPSCRSAAEGGRGERTRGTRGRIVMRGLPEDYGAGGGEEVGRRVVLVELPLASELGEQRLEHVERRPPPRGPPL